MWKRKQDRSWFLGNSFNICLGALSHELSPYFCQLMPQLSFELQQTDTYTKARAGKIITDHGEILTPIFMPVGTVGTVKAVTQQQLSLDVQAILIIYIYDQEQMCWRLLVVCTSLMDGTNPY